MLTANSILTIQQIENTKKYNYSILGCLLVYKPIIIFETSINMVLTHVFVLINNKKLKEKDGDSYYPNSCRSIGNACRNRWNNNSKNCGIGLLYEHGIVTVRVAQSLSA